MAGSTGMNEQKKKTPGPFGPGHHEKRLIFDYNKLIGFCFSNFPHVFPADNFIFLERSVNVLLNLTLIYKKCNKFRFLLYLSRQVSIAI